MTLQVMTQAAFQKKMESPKMKAPQQEALKLLMMKFTKRTLMYLLQAKHNQSHER